MNELVDRHHGVVFRTCVAILNDEDQAADASQICFIKAFRAIDRFRGEAAIRTWLLADTNGRSAIQLLKNSPWQLYRTHYQVYGERTWDDYKQEWMNKDRRY